jgi:PASTA domain
MTSLTDINIQAFAEAVRAELADLPKREIQELTDGLEADLAEKLVDEGVDFASASAAEYAAELRDAAGVAPKYVKRKAFSSQAFDQNVEDWFRKNSFGTSILEFGLSIRPVWWLLRALIGWALFMELFYSFSAGLILLPVFMFLSVQWGRKKWFTNKFFAAILLPLNLFAFVAFFPVQAMVIQKLNDLTASEQMLQAWPSSDGLRLNGEPITELKAFDSEMNEVTGLTFQDQLGNSIETHAKTLAQFSIPDIMGMNLFEATQTLSEAGIPAVDFIYIDGATETTGIVVQVEPSTPGDLVTKLDTVTVTIGVK